MEAEKIKSMNIFKSKWGKWTDLSVVYWNNSNYLLQGRRHQNGKIQFRVAKPPAYTSSAPINIDDIKKVQP